MSNFWQISRYLNPALQCNISEIYLNPALQIYFLRWKVCWRSKKPTEAEIPPFDQPCLGDKLQRRFFYSWNFDWRVTTHPKVWNVKRWVCLSHIESVQPTIFDQRWMKQTKVILKASHIESWELKEPYKHTESNWVLVESGQETNKGGPEQTMSGEFQGEIDRM